MKQWLMNIDQAVLAMGMLRIVSGLTELTAALLILYWADAKKALAINGVLATVGPTILIASLAIGIVSISNGLPLSKLLFIFGGVTLLLIGIFK